MSSLNRRELFKGLLTVTGVVALGSAFGSKAIAQERRRGGAAPAAGPVAADPNDPALKSMSYVHKFSDLKDKSIVKEKQGVKPADQKCSACSFYVKEQEAKIDGKTFGGCQMPQFNGKLISKEGYCTSWNKKT